jgi:quercetin dioxygenase-like cupin family protein
MKENGIVYTPTNGTRVSSPEPGMQRQVLAYNKNVMLVRHHFLKGWQGTNHRHPHEQLVYVVTGRIQFEGDGKTIELRSGDSVIVEGNVEHRAIALEDSEVLDLFAPYREDYAQSQSELLFGAEAGFLPKLKSELSATRFSEAAAPNKPADLSERAAENG